MEPAVLELVLCVGGPLDGRRIVASRELKHDEIVRAPVRAILSRVSPRDAAQAAAWEDLPAVASYRVWEWADQDGSVFLLADPEMLPRDIIVKLIEGYRESGR